MKAKDVMKVLQISRATLYRYTKAGKIKVSCEINGQYRYSAESVFALLNQPVPAEYQR
jgi:predicted site-specific integrase-resolvase